MSVVERLASVKARLAEACVAAGREPEEVQLIAVSKKQPVLAIREALAAGQVHFGENYAQELRDKAAAVPQGVWHFIGRLQRNKAKYVARVAHRVHAVERVEIAEALVARAEDGIDLLVAVNVAGESSKGGVPPREVRERVGALAQVPDVRVRGLMCLPPFQDDPEDTAPYFEELASLLADCRADGHDLTELSMGMSHDFHVAVRHGATHVRVGTAIFGPRPA